MAKNKSIFELIFELSAKLPYWLSLIFSVIAYVVFGLYESSLADPGEATNIFSKSFNSTFVPMIKWVLVGTFLFAALASFIAQIKRGRLLANTASNDTQSALNDMSWQEFEQLVHELFRRQGYFVTPTVAGPDGGIDLILEKGQEKVYVQCKQWRAKSVGVKIVRELYGVMSADNVTKGMVVTSGVFTPDAIEFAKSNNIALIDGEILFKDIKQLKLADNTIQSSVGNTSEQTPCCPKCGSAMVKRIARQGTNAGKPFWGCQQYPKCRGIISISK